MSWTTDNLSQRARAYLLASAEVKRRAAEVCAGQAAEAAEFIAAAFRAGGKLLLCGNGGSAADCQHLAAEFVSTMRKEVHREGLPALALTTDTSFLTAFSNDFGFEGVFERQVRALGRAGDVLLAVSTSGNSANVLRAVEAARSLGMPTVALTGAQGKLAQLADVAIQVPSDDTQHIQECHLALEHLLCDLTECLLFTQPARESAGESKRV
jgi:D-sedoheptulose 7-phosphate isomerase